jgi:hypothetical protein
VASSHIDRFVLSFGVGTHGEAGSLLIGGQACHGFGKMLAPNAHAVEPTPVAAPAQT